MGHSPISKKKITLIHVYSIVSVLSLDPVIGAIAAGNAVVLKPSEVAPATSSLLAELLPRYVDSTCIKVVEGGVSETTALLELKWDKIFYTGQRQSISIWVLAKLKDHLVSLRIKRMLRWKIAGNSKVGRMVMASAAKHLTPVVLELGGKCPVVVDSNINLHV
jgi:aldehyde dehydrogenase (NAD+)